MTKNSIRILCIDPALSITGIAILDLHKPTKNNTSPEIVVHTTALIKSAQEASRVAYRDETNRFGKFFISLDMLKASTQKLMNQYKPDYVVIEDAFFHPKRPSAYASLLQCICAISVMCKDHYNMPVTRVPTRSAKKCLFGSGAGNKKDIIGAVKNVPDIKFKHVHTKDDLVEHEADAIAVGYYFILNVLAGIRQMEQEVLDRIPKGGK